MIYLDNAATTAVIEPVIASMTAILQENYGNPSSLHQLGRKASQIVRQSRETIARLLQVPVNSIIFTSGASEANSQAIIGYALAHRQEGNHLLTTAIEHPSVLNAFKYLHERHGFDVTYLLPNSDGTYSLDLFEKHLQEDTLLVSVMYANNETGQMLPVQEIGQMLQNHPAVFHVDATQVMGKIIIHPEELFADFLSASAHKFHGPKGVGFLYHKALKFDEIIQGGEQEDKHRAGTENLHSLAGMATALEIANQNIKENFEQVSNLKAQILSELDGFDFYLNEFGPTMPHVLNIAFPSANHDLLLTQLDMAGFAISTGSACTAGTVEPSHVLEAVYGKDDKKLKENIRVSLSELNTAEEITAFTSTLKNILNK